MQVTPEAVDSIAVLKKPKEDSMHTTRKITLALTIAAALAIMAGCSTGARQVAATQASPEADWRFHDIVDAQFVADHIAYPMPENVMIIDSRPKQVKYDKGHIPMAVSISDSQFEKMTDMLPNDKSALLIFYCGGLECKLSHKSAAKAEALGYTNVKVFAEGFPGWMKVNGNYAAVSTEWVKKQLDSQADMLLVDSRPKRMKYDKGHIPTAISIPDSQFDKMTNQLPADKGKLVVFYCGGLHCKLSHKSAAKALAMGYTNVKVYAAGYPAWKAMAGTATMAQKPAPQIASGGEEGTIDHEAFKKIIAENPDSIFLVDVRDKDEYQKGSLKTAVNIPVDELESKISTLPTDKPIVFICGTGARSGESYYMMQDLKPELKNVFYLDGEMSIKKDGSFTLKKSV
jgi:rhodanese-related sulfurtransferase